MTQCKWESSYYMKLKLWLQIAGGFGILGGVVSPVAFHWPQCKAGNQQLQRLKNKKQNKNLINSSSKILNFDFLNNVNAHRNQDLDWRKFGFQSFRMGSAWISHTLWGARTYVHVLVNFLKPLLGKSIRRWGGDGALRKEAKDSLRGRAGTCVLAERG